MSCIYWCLFLFLDVLYLFVPCFYFQMFSIYWYPLSVFRCLLFTGALFIFFKYILFIGALFLFQISCHYWCPVSIFRCLVFIGTLVLSTLFIIKRCFAIPRHLVFSDALLQLLDVFIGILLPFSVFIGALFLFSDVLYLLKPFFHFQYFWCPVSIFVCIVFIGTLYWYSSCAVLNKHILWSASASNIRCTWCFSFWLW